MPCRPPRHLAAPPVPELLDRPRDPGLRVGDADRERTAALVADAAAGGHLRLDELDERLTRVWSATTAGDLAEVEADLPVELRRRRARRVAVERARAAARAELLPHVASYVGVMLLLVGIWLVVGLAGGSWYPWPVWPALGWGIALAGHARAAFAGDRPAGSGRR